MPLTSEDRQRIKEALDERARKRADIPKHRDEYQRLLRQHGGHEGVKAFRRKQQTIKAKADGFVFVGDDLQCIECKAVSSRFTNLARRAHKVGCRATPDKPVKPA